MTASKSPRLRGVLASAAALVFATSLLVASPASAASAAHVESAAPSAVAAPTATQASAPASSVSTGMRKTANLALFRAGNIISDAVFFNSGTMNAGQIDSFLRSKVSVCRSGYTCLKDWRQNTPTRPADNYCNGYAGAGGESAATILFKVAQSCGINPQVLIVMLEKEQSLVTMTYPGIGRFNAAMGQGCPDTAGCDPNYAGFFYQVYGAARQMKIYAEGKWFTYYAPGKTWNIRYNPEVACGSSPVYVENIATSALYYYTPYQPNAAAIAAGYGKGDGCSAHGNRNFYQYFTDWFGSTQGNSGSLVRASNANEIYLVSGGTKHYVTTPSDLNALSVRLGAVQTMSPSYVAGLPTGNRVIRLVRDDRDGAMYLLQPDGTKHHFASAALISRYGMRVDDYLPLSPSLVNAFPTGVPVGDYFRSEDSPDYYKWENGQRRHIANGLAWQREQAAANNYVAVFPAGNAAVPPRGRSLLAPGTLVKENSRNEVYIVGNGTELTHIPSFEMAADAGVAAYQTVVDGTLSGYTANTALAPLFTCGAQTFVVDGGKVTGVANTARTGKGPALPESVCAVLPRSGTTFSHPVFVKVKGGDPIYSLENGTLRHVQSGELLLHLNGGRFPYTASWSLATVNAFPKGLPYLAEGAFVTFGSDTVYVVRSRQLRAIPNTDTLIRLAAPAWPIPIVRLDAAALASYTVGAPLG